MAENVTLEKSGGYISVDPQQAIDANRKEIQQIRELWQQATGQRLTTPPPPAPVKPQANQE
jgi:hypothetical protein